VLHCREERGAGVDEGGCHGALCKIPTGRHRLSDVAASGPVYQARWSSGTERLADESRQRDWLSGFDCARWHDVVGSAGNDFVLRAGVQRRAYACHGYDFEQATKARVLPKHTPALPSDVLGMAAARITP